MLGIKLKGKDGLFTPPTYSHVYLLKTVQQSNDKGTWFGWEVSKIGQVQETELYQQARVFAENKWIEELTWYLTARPVWIQYP